MRPLTDRFGSTVVFLLNELFVTVHVDDILNTWNNKQEFVQPRWPYDMRPSARAEKYMCVIVIR